MLQWLLPALPALLISLAIAGVASFSPALLNEVQQEYGLPAKMRVLAWQQLIEDDRGKSTMQIIRSVNAFFNKVPFISDQKHWGRADYWATPIELLASDGGDCEDYSIAKYFTLRELGIPDDELRITYVKAIKLNQAHMVLAYYPEPDAEPLILDNLINAILPASKRTDLVPVYSFNGTGLWVAKEKGSGYVSLGDPGRISFWRDMNIRMKKERELGESYTSPGFDTSARQPGTLGSPGP